MIAKVTPAEFVSAVARRRRECRLLSWTARAIRLPMDRNAGRAYTIIPLQMRVVYRAEDLLETYTLRAYDAVQLASAPESNGCLVAAGLVPFVLVSADARLLTLASSAGLASDDPATRP